MKADRFITALRESESQHSAEPLLALFADDVELQRINSEEPYRGHPGAEDFWNEYVSLFKDIHSDFTNVIEAGDYVVLEWTAHGHFGSDAPISYRGVSILEYAGDEVRRFRTYYDSAAFTHLAHA